VALDADFVLDEAGERAAIPHRHVPEQRTARAKSDMSWSDFALAVHGIRDLRTKAVVLALVVLAEGNKGVPVDFDAVAQAVGRSATTLKTMRTRLWDAGWIEPKPALADDGRPVRRWVTARSVGDA
jgi:predicted transcriptional regulator